MHLRTSRTFLIAPFPRPTSVLPALLVAALLGPPVPANAADCTGAPLRLENGQTVRRLESGGIAMLGRMNINMDGYGRPYHRDNLAGGGVLHLCNAGRPFLPDGTSYNASESNDTCSGRFTQDLARIRAAGWRDPQVGAVRWFGIVGTGEVALGGQRVSGVVPVEQPDGSGFYVSPTTLADPGIADVRDQRRYVDAATVSHAVIPSSAQLRAAGIVPGTAGVAMDRRKGIAVPFIVADIGPRIGEGSTALARRVAGQPVVPPTRQTRFAGQVDGQDVVWVMFGGARIDPPYSQDALAPRLDAVFAAWGGRARLDACLASGLPAS